MLKISACVITKNEEENLPQWLSCVMKIADELIVVDTGSTDRTVALAKEAGAKVYHFEWIDDFSAAKNYALEKATGNWIIFLDADEYFTPNARKRVRSVIEENNGNHKILFLDSPLYNINKDVDNQIINVCEQRRIFRNKPYIRYTSRIHEYLVVLRNKKYTSISTDLVIYHTGYSSSISRKKNERNLKLLMQDIEKTGEMKPFHYPYLAISYFNLHDFEKTIQYARKALDNNCGGMPMLQIKLYDLILNSLKWQEKQDEEIQRVIDEALAAVPLHPDFVYENAAMAMKHKQYVFAEKEFLRAIHLFEHMADNGIQDIESTLEGNFYRLYNTLGQIYIMKGEKKQAVLCLKKSLQHYSYAVSVLCKLLHLVRDEDAIQTIDFLNDIYDIDNPKDLKFVQDCLEHSPRNEVYLYYRRPAPESYEAMMAVGLYRQAAEEAANRLKEAYERTICIYDRDGEKEVWDVLLPANMLQEVKAQ